MKLSQLAATFWVTLLSSWMAGQAFAADPELDRLKQLGEQCTAAMTKAFSKNDSHDLLQMTYPKVIEKGGGEAKMADALGKVSTVFSREGISWSVSSVEAPDRITEAGGKFFALVPFTVELLSPKGHFRLPATLLAVSENQKKDWYLIDTTGMNDHPDWVKEWFPSGFGGLEIPQKKVPVKVDQK